MVHAPGHIRETFLGWLDNYGFDFPESIDDHVEISESESCDVRQLVEELTTCSDILPGTYCQQLDIEQGSTYAQACESILQWFKSQARLQKALTSKGAQK